MGGHPRHHQHRHGHHHWNIIIVTFYPSPSSWVVPPGGAPHKQTDRWSSSRPPPTPTHQYHPNRHRRWKLTVNTSYPFSCDASLCGVLHKQAGVWPSSSQLPYHFHHDYRHRWDIIVITITSHPSSSGAFLSGDAIITSSYLKIVVVNSNHNRSLHRHNCTLQPSRCVAPRIS